MVRMVETKDKVMDKKRTLRGRDVEKQKSPSENNFFVSVSRSPFKIIINSPLKQNLILTQII
ncbi:hypothetical protein PanWU01x14_189870 [Parasponia andersonii]|uniref:Uncharacterized protein n=1 Tax=Parasponia andersonii TaxID=3476 RepID=A0A2P5C2K6_PARAD|nr:hypothetical protein PanWU01x14_189870 [Parasponia andersonii]